MSPMPSSCRLTLKSSLADSIDLSSEGVHPMAMDPSASEKGSTGGGGRPVRQRYYLPTSDAYPAEDNGGPHRARAALRACIVSVARVLASYVAVVRLGGAEGGGCGPTSHGGSAEHPGEGGGVTGGTVAVEFERRLGVLPWWAAGGVDVDMVGSAVGFDLGRGGRCVGGVRGEEVRAKVERILADFNSLGADSYVQGAGVEGEGVGDWELEAEPVVVSLFNTFGEGKAYIETFEGGSGRVHQDHDVAHAGASFS